MGFTFDDSNPDATSIAEMQRLIEKDPRNQERIFPYIGGEEVNSSPTHAHHRYVINTGEMSEAEFRQYPDLMEVLENKVKPERAKLNVNTADGRRRKERWWLWGRYTPALFRAISECGVVLAIARTSKAFAFTLLSSNQVFSENLIVFPLTNYFIGFAVLQSHVHEIWVRFFSSSLKDDLGYRPSDCFETFPFSENWETDTNLESTGKRYYDFRADLMVRNNEGLTQTYNRFHDPNELDPDILQLRQLHEEMDLAVLAAYGWHDLQPQCEFLLDYEDEEEDEDEAAPQRQRKKPYRYRWNEATHDEVLARLLALNQQRYETEILGGKSAANGKSKGAKAKKGGRSSDLDTPMLPGLEA